MEAYAVNLYSRARRQGMRRRGGQGQGEHQDYLGQQTGEEVIRQIRGKCFTKHPALMQGSHLFKWNENRQQQNQPNAQTQEIDAN